MTKHVTQFSDHTFLVIKAFYIFVNNGYLIVKDPNRYKGKGLSKAIKIFLANNSLSGRVHEKIRFSFFDIFIFINIYIG